MRARQWMQIAAVASAASLTGAAIANDMDRASTSRPDTATTISGNPAQLDNDATNPATSVLPDNTVTAPEVGTPQSNDNGATMNDNAGTSNLNGDASTIDNGAPSTTQGSTMVSPKSDTAAAPSGGARYGSGSSATSIGGTDRLGSTNSENFDQWASDYAAQHNGRITRQEFLDQMGNRWDVLDNQHRGYLTPQEMQELLIATPGDTAAPPRTGSDAQAGDMGPGSARGD
jgi:hypothetical protein